MGKHGEPTQRTCKRCAREFWSTDPAAKVCQSRCDQSARSRATGKRRKAREAGQLVLFTDEAK